MNFRCNFAELRSSSLGGDISLGAVYWQENQVVGSDILEAVLWPDDTGPFDGNASWEHQVAYIRGSIFGIGAEDN